MNYKNYLLIALFSVSSIVTANEVKWGVSLGYENIDYGLTLENQDPGLSSSGFTGDNAIVEGSMSYGALALGFDVRVGKHSLSIKNSNGEADDLMPSADYPTAGWSHTDTNDRSETSVNYSYKINGNWSFAAGFYTGENEMDFTNNRSYIYTDYDFPFNWDDIESGKQTASSEGLYLAGVYQDKITDQLFWFAKVGYQASDFEVSQQFEYSEQAVLSEYGASQGLTQETLVAGFDNGTGFYAWDVNYMMESSGSAAVLGLGLVYVLAPTDTITLGIERKAFSYDPGEVMLYNYAGKTQGNLSSVGDIDAEEAETFDEEADYITLTYRHQF